MWWITDVDQSILIDQNSNSSGGISWDALPLRLRLTHGRYSGDLGQVVTRDEDLAVRCRAHVATHIFVELALEQQLIRVGKSLGQAFRAVVLLSAQRDGIVPTFGTAKSTPFAVAAGPIHRVDPFASVPDRL